MTVRSITPHTTRIVTVRAVIVPTTKTRPKYSGGSPSRQWRQHRSDAEHEKRSVTPQRNLQRREGGTRSGITRTAIHDASDSRPSAEELRDVRNKINNGSPRKQKGAAKILAALQSVKVRDYDSSFISYKQCFLGSQVVDALISNGCATTRRSAVKIGRSLAGGGAGVLRHVNGTADFEDDDMYYKFVKSLTIETVYSIMEHASREPTFSLLLETDLVKSSSCPLQSLMPAVSQSFRRATSEHIAGSILYQQHAQEWNTQNGSEEAPDSSVRIPESASSSSRRTALERENGQRNLESTN